MKKSVFIFLCLASMHFFNNSIDFSRYFNGKPGCFILFDLNKNKLVAKYNPDRCKERIPAHSTFKIALSLMAFDQHLISQETVFKWDGTNRELGFLNQDQTPQTWLKNSAVWVSQELTPKLGYEKINYYLKQFNYGNQDFSGDPGKNNGLTNAWLSSSLKISADEQLDFLKKLVMDRLSISQNALISTKENMYLETLPSGWKLYGKTGSGTHKQCSRFEQLLWEDGWFVGCVQKNYQIYVFVLNFSDRRKYDISEGAGARAKIITKDVLCALNIL